ncbi:MAG: Spy/CpxP family protein refolding chaperone [Desulfoprunum sp.]|nr:Spy/CpxP family protein refolding chaperone [Desulfoprunum sp.]
MKKWAIVIVTLLTGGSLLLFGGCKHGLQGKEARIDFIIDYLEEVLDLDTHQQAKLAEIRKELTAELVVLQESRKKMYPLFKEQLASEKIDTAVVKQAIGEHRQQFDRVFDLAIERLAEFHAILTPAQRQKLLAKLEKMEKSHGKCVIN